MIEVYLTKNDTYWTLRATILPQGGISGLAKEAELSVIEEPTFQAAYTSITPLSEVSFARNDKRWPVPDPKFQIINQGNHSDRKHFGNYHVRRNGEILGVIDNFPRGETLELIKRALEIVASSEKVPIKEGPLLEESN